MLHAQVKLLHCIPLHVRAFVAGTAVVGRRRVEDLTGTLFFHLVNDPWFRSNNELLVLAIARKPQQAGGRTYVIGYIKDVRFTFGVRDEGSLRVLHLQLSDLFVAEYLVDHAGTVPQYHITAGLFYQPAAQVDVGRKDNRLVFWDGINDVTGVRAGTTDVR